MFSATLYLLAVQLRKQSQLPVLLTASGYAPELSIAPKFLWHLFVSHVWSTGQVPELCFAPHAHTAPFDDKQHEY